MQKSVRKMIDTKVKEGFSKNEQAKEYVKQLDEMERMIYAFCGDEPFEDHMYVLKSVFGDDHMTNYSVWILNVFSLIELGVIQNDELNGWMIVSNYLYDL